MAGTDGRQHRVICAKLSTLTRQVLGRQGDSGMQTEGNMIKHSGGHCVLALRKSFVRLLEDTKVHQVQKHR